MKKFYLIDANSLIHRTFHALPPLTSNDGAPAQALYGLSAILLKILREDKPDYAVALFDRPEPTFRKEKYSEYKAHRAETPGDLKSQLVKAHELFAVFGIRTYEIRGYEADDLIATFAHHFAKNRDTQTVILTGDLDPLQLVESDRIVLRAIKRGVSETVLYDEPAVVGKYGIRPEQMVDYKSLVGDASDNIRGVLGIGPKTACDILKKYKSLGIAMRDLPRGSKIGERLREEREKLELARSLVELERNVPIDLPTISELEVKNRDGEIGNYFRAMGFKTLAERLRKEITPKQKSLF